MKIHDGMSEGLERCLWERFTWEEKPNIPEEAYQLSLEDPDFLTAERIDGTYAVLARKYEAFKNKIRGEF